MCVVPSLIQKIPTSCRIRIRAFYWLKTLWHKTSVPSVLINLWMAQIGIDMVRGEDLIYLVEYE